MTDLVEISNAFRLHYWGIDRLYDVRVLTDVRQSLELFGNTSGVKRAGKQRKNAAQTLVDRALCLL